MAAAEAIPDALAARNESAPSRALIDEELERDSIRLRQYIRWAVLPNLAFLPALYGFAAWAGSRLALVLGALMTLNAIGFAIAYRLAARRRVAAAAVWQVAILWIVGGTLAIGVGLDAMAITALDALFPLVVAVSYVSKRALGWMTAISTAMVALAALWIFGVRIELLVLPPSWMKPVVVVGVTTFAASACYSLWQTRSRISGSLARLHQANRVLEESEQSLERRVAERTAQLEASQRDVANARDAAMAANQRKSAFLAKMSHELRTPLNAIIGFSEVMDARYFGELNAKQGEYVKDIHQSGHHLLGLIEDILDLSKVDDGVVELVRSRFDLGASVDAAFTLIKERATRRGVVLGREIDPSVGDIVADERKLRQMLANLLGNAVKFTPRGGSVSLRVAREGGGLLFSVADTGVGIPEDQQAMVFEPFRQADGEAAATQGTGLGLPLTRRFAEVHGGRLWLESEAEAGSTFHFTLPRAFEPLGEPGETVS